MTELQAGSELCFPQLLNSSCRKPSVSWSDVVFLRCLLSSVSVLTVTLNLLVIVSVSYFRQLHRPTNLLLLSLAVSDFLVGFVFFPGEILRKTSCWFLGDVLCSLYLYVAIVCVAASVANMVLISADRYAAICDPLHYPTRVTVGRTRLCIFLSWFCLTFYNTLFVKDNLFQRHRSDSCRGQCVFNVEFIPGVVDLVVSFILPVSVIIVLYVRVFAVAVSQARSMRSHVTAVALHRAATVLAKRSELKAARTLGVLVALFLLCFCPFFCVSLTGENLLNSSYGVFVTLIFSFNPCLNPVIYALFYPWFRKAVKLIITLQILQPGSREANVL